MAKRFAAELKAKMEDNMEKLTETLRQIVTEEAEDRAAARAALEDGAYLGQLKARLGCTDEEPQAAVEELHAELDEQNGASDRDWRNDHEYEINGHCVCMSAEQAARWNSGEITEAECEKITVHVPTSGEDRSFLRDGEVVYRPGLPGGEQKTLLELAEELAGYPANRIE